MQRYLVKLGLSPVQSFIEEAVRTRDPVNASRLVTLTMRTLTNTFVAQGGVLSIPASHETRFLPNVIVGALTTENEPALKMALGEICAAGRAAWCAALRPAELAELHPQTFADDQAWLDELFSLRWVARETNAMEEDADWLALDELFEARKRTRLFPPYPAIEPTIRDEREICTLCGLRPATILIGINWTQAYQTEGAMVRRRERLCRVCLGKRQLALAQDERIPTLAELASEPYRRRLSDTPQEAGVPVDAAWEALRQALVEAIGPGYRQPPESWRVLDGAACSFLYGHALSSIYPIFADENSGGLLPDYVALGHLHENFLTALTKAFGAPGTYFTIALLDGDHMGCWLAGQGRSKGETLDAYRRRFSQALQTSAAESKTAIEEGGGYPVYLGGDDLCALLPAEGALSAITRLQSIFAKHMSGFIAEEKHPTLSASLLFSPINEPLHEALLAARAGLRFAKNDLGRDALALSFRLSSNTSYRFGANWLPFAGQPPLADFCIAVAQHIAKNTLSPAFLYDIEGYLPVFYDVQGRYQEALARDLMCFVWKRHHADKEHTPPLPDSWIAHLNHQALSGRGNLQQALRTLAVLAREGFAKLPERMAT